MVKELLSKDIQPIEKKVTILEATSEKSFRKVANRMIFKLGKCLNINPSGKAFRYSGRDFLELVGSGISAFVSLTSIGESELSDSRPLNIISGTCLFGVDGLQAVDRFGNSYSLTDPLEGKLPNGLQEVKKLDCIHPSEAESALRITEAMKILFNKRPVSDNGLFLHFHLPLPEYFLYLVEHFQSGVLGEEVVSRSLGMVVERADMIENLFAKRLPSGMAFTMSSPLDPIIDIIKNKGCGVSIAELAKGLANRDELWALLIEKFYPNSFIELNYLSYAYLYHQVQIRTEQSGGECLAIEESKEARILTQAKAQSQLLPWDLRMNALYIAPKVISLRGKHGKDELFMHETSGESIGLQLRSVVTGYRRRGGG